MLRGCGKGKRLGRKKYSLRPCLSFLCFSYRLSPPPSVTEYFSPWSISGQKVLDSDKTVYKDVLNNRLLCPPPAYPIANHFSFVRVCVWSHPTDNFNNFWSQIMTSLDYFRSISVIEVLTGYAIVKYFCDWYMLAICGAVGLPLACGDIRFYCDFFWLGWSNLYQLRIQL